MNIPNQASLRAEHVRPGMIAGWIQHGGPNWGVVAEMTSGKVVLRHNQQRTTLPVADLSVVASGDVSEVITRAQEGAEHVDSAEIWHALSAGFGREPFSVQQARVFLTWTEDRDPVLWLALWRRPEYFARAGRTRFRARSETEMQAERERIAQRQREERVLGHLDELVEQYRDGSVSLSGILGEDEIIRQVVRHMVYGDVEPPLSDRGRKSVESVLTALYQEENPAWPLTFFWAQQMDDADPWGHGNPELCRHRHWVQTYQATTVAQDPALLPELQSETTLWAIDDAGTVERDDAIGVSVAEGRYTVEVAIADVAAGPAANVAILEQAVRTGTTIYLPTQTIPMLPPEIGAERHSLQTAASRPVFLVRVQLDAATGAPLSSPVVERGMLQLEGITDYDQAEQGSSPVTWWQDALRVSELLHQRRMESGAGDIQIPDVMIDVIDGHPTGFREMKPWLGARAVVREFMILANAAFAGVLKLHGLAAPFRAMERRGNGMIAKVDFRPGKHAGLGVPEYVYASSPIRRLSDILAQIQLASLFGGARFEPRDMQRWITRSESAFQASRRWMEMAQRYWKLRYLEAHADMSLYARVDARGSASQTRTRVRLEPLGLVVVVPQELSESERVRPVRLKHVDAERDELEIEVDP